LAGFVHRGRQGVDIVRSMWPRLTSARARIGAVAAVTLVLIGALVWTGGGRVSAGVPAEQGVKRVVLVGVPHMSPSDMGSGTMPTLDRLSSEGASAATNVRTLSVRPSSSEAYATLGAGVRVRADRRDAAEAYPAGTPYEDGTAADVAARRVGETPDGEIVVPRATAMVRGAGGYLSSRPGALGQALTDDGLRTAVVNNADSLAQDGSRVVYRPAAAAVVDSDGGVGTGTVAPSSLLVADRFEPYGLRADVDAYVEATMGALGEAELVVADLGDMNRAAWQAPHATPSVNEATRTRALRRVDQYLDQLVRQIDENTLVLVVGVRPRTGAWELTPTVAYGAGVVRGSLYSPSTKREGLVTLTDIAPTVLDALDVPLPKGMVGSAFRYRAEPFDQLGSQRLNDLAASRERVYKPMALTFVVLQALAYLVIVVLLSQGAAARGTAASGGGSGGSGGSGNSGGGRWSWRRVDVRQAVRLVVLTFAAWPLATFLERAVPGIEDIGPGARQGLLWLLAAGVAVAASRARKHPLAPLSWITGTTLLLLVVDVASGAQLQMASVLGYSPHTAARYIGFGNTAFAVLAACAVVLVAAHVSYAPRKSEAVVTAAGVLAIVLVADIWPTLGADVGCSFYRHFECQLMTHPF
jgi:hypothetical protein